MPYASSGKLGPRLWGGGGWGLTGSEVPRSDLGPEACNLKNENRDSVLKYIVPRCYGVLGRRGHKRYRTNPSAIAKIAARPAAIVVHALHWLCSYTKRRSNLGVVKAGLQATFCAGGFRNLTTRRSGDGNQLAGIGLSRAGFLLRWISQSCARLIGRRRSCPTARIKLYTLLSTASGKGAAPAKPKSSGPTLKPSSPSS